MSVPALPEEVWKLVLQHVPLQGRLGSCSLVSRAWRSAAAAATQDISVDLKLSKEKEAALEDWLQAHGHCASSLDLRHATSLPQLPCPQLKDLRLFDCAKVQLCAGSSGQPGVLQSCTRLTRLALNDCSVLDEQGALDALSLLVSLESLRVQQPRSRLRGSLPWRGVKFPGAVLPNLTHLTQLELVALNAEGLQHLSCLSTLCELQLWLNTPFTLAPSLAPGFVLPVSLHSLILYTYAEGSVLDPAVLHPLTNLEVLVVVNLTLANRSGAALFGVLPGLQKLQRLRLFCVLTNWPVDSAGYSALVSSSTLTELGLNIVGVLQHMFTPGRVLPQLRKLTVWNDNDDGDNDQTNLWDQAAVVNAIRCCPGLQALECSLQPGVSAAPLTQLHTLTNLDLCLYGSLADCMANVQTVASFTKLQHLDLLWPDVGSVELDVLVPLTLLRQLTHLSCCNVTVAGGVEEVVLLNKAAPSAAPDVWQQLLKQLLPKDTCWSSLTQGLSQLAAQAAQAEEQQQLNAQLQQQVAEHQQIIADLQSQVEQLQQHR